jgi:hypothetical protein
MTKRSRSLLLFLVMLWQVLLLLVPFNIAERAQALSHAMEHSEALLHHHHQDQSLHLEEATGQAIDHVHTDSGFSSAGLVPSGWPTVGVLTPFVHLAMASASIPFPHLEGPLRPPQHLV